MNKFMIIFLSLFIASCGGFKENMGLVKHQPDEYQVETNDSLAVPPDFNIHSPEELIAKKSRLSTQNSDDNSLSKGENLILKNMN